MIGIGSIGMPMCRNLVDAGYQLKVYSRNYKKKMNPLTRGTRFCKDVSHVFTNIEALIICVSDDNAVEEVIFGENGASKKIKKGSLIIDCSTISPTKAIECFDRLKCKGIGYIDAPVTGGTEGALSGTLTILVGGEIVDFKRATPLFEVIGRNIYHFGHIGNGQKAKAINQILVACTYAGVAEAITLGKRLNMPIKQVVQALSQGAGDSWALNHRSKSMIDRNYPLGFKLELHHKDLEIVNEISRKLDLKLPATETIMNIESDLIQSGYKGKDISVLHEWYNLQEE